MKIISGGQYGADLGGLLASEYLGIETGGWAPRGFLTCRGLNPDLKKYGLKETQSCGYTSRTLLNVKDSDCTIIIASNINSPGTRQTIRFCKQHSKPYFIFQDDLDINVQKAIKCLELNENSVINIAGNRDKIGTFHQDLSLKITFKILSRISNGTY